MSSRRTLGTGAARLGSVGSYRGNPLAGMMSRGGTPQSSASGPPADISARINRGLQDLLEPPGGVSDAEVSLTSALNLGLSLETSTREQMPSVRERSAPGGAGAGSRREGGKQQPAYSRPTTSSALSGRKKVTANLANPYAGHTNSKPAGRVTSMSSRPTGISGRSTAPRKSVGQDLVALGSQRGISSHEPYDPFGGLSDSDTENGGGKENFSKYSPDRLQTATDWLMYGSDPKERVRDLQRGKERNNDAFMCELDVNEEEIFLRNKDEALHDVIVGLLEEEESMDTFRSSSASAGPLQPSLKPHAGSNIKAPPAGSNFAKKDRDNISMLTKQARSAGTTLRKKRELIDAALQNARTDLASLRTDLNTATQHYTEQSSFMKIDAQMAKMRAGKGM